MKDYVCDQCHKRGGVHAPGCQRLLSQLKAVGARLQQDEREKAGASK